MKNEFEKIFEQLADFRTLAGYDGWMIGACVYAQWEAVGERVSGTEFGCGNDLTVVQNQNIKIQNSCKSEIVKKTASFAVMRNQIEEDGIVYQLELHVVRPEVQGEGSGRQVGMEENMGMNVEKLKLEEQRMDLHHSVGTEETTDTGEGKTFSFTNSDILRFVDAVGDTNSIHRTAHAVVPGLLMVEWMLDVWMRKQPGKPDSGMFICRFRFEKPVYVDEKLQVQARTERGKQIYECKREDKEIVWNMRIL